MATKIQIPTSGDAHPARTPAGGQCFWASNGNNTYNISLPPKSFVEFPSGGTIQAKDGGNSETVTVANLPSGTVIGCSFTKVAGGSYASTDDVTQSGQSDIVVDP